jgi:aminomethyltransferase
LAVQGPNSGKVLKKLIKDMPELEYYHFTKGKVAGIEMIISRTGYTGEIGYEIYFIGDVSQAEKVWDEIFKAGKEFDIQPVGLAARDSLRLEMGYCLYGNDIDKTTNPIEAGLGWITKTDKGEFIGKNVILKVKQEGPGRKLVAMISDEKTFPRHGYEICSAGKKVGVITSGTVSPVIEKPIALGYVDKPLNMPGSQVAFKIRDKEFAAVVTKLPFVKK